MKIKYYKKIQDKLMSWETMQEQQEHRQRPNTNMRIGRRNANEWIIMWQDKKAKKIGNP